MDGVNVTMDEKTNSIEPHKLCIIKLINEELYGNKKIRIMTSLQPISNHNELIQWINNNNIAFFKISYPILGKILNELYECENEVSR
jgi:hypothetical protein